MPGPFSLITTPHELAALLETLSTQPIVAVDTESNSLYAYQERVCLIQLSTPDADMIVDPLADLDLAPLARLFADPGVQKVFHAAEYDLLCLKRDFGFHFANLFDTMWAARILGWPRVGLGDVLRETFSVHTSKRYQRHNWGHRPLEPEALDYARLDTHYLLPLRQLQIDGLIQKGRLEEAEQVFEQIAAAETNARAFDPQGFWRIKGVFDLTRREQAVLRALAAWRDQVARRRDCPVFKVLHDQVLLALAQASPRQMGELAAVRGMNSRRVHHYGEDILRAIAQGTRARLPAPPPAPPRRSEEEIERFQALKAWRKQVAAAREVDADVVVGNAVLWALAEHPPHTLQDLEHVQELTPRKRSLYGQGILQVLADLRARQSPACSQANLLTER